MLPVGGGVAEVANDSTSQVFKLPIFDIRVSVDAAIRIGVCVLLCIQNSAYTLSRRYGSGVLKEAASSQSILAVGEIMKLLFSVVMIRRQQQQQGGAEAGAAESPIAAARRLAVSSLPMAVPAFIFLAMNLLSFVALRRISASAFTPARTLHSAILAVPQRRSPGLLWRSLKAPGRASHSRMRRWDD